MTDRDRERRVGRGRRLVVLVMLGLALVGMGTGAAIRASRPAALGYGEFTVEVAGRLGTGHQRADRLTFADGGRLLAVACPRYNRVVLYRVVNRPGRGANLEKAHDFEVEGRPVALGAGRDRIYVLQRPAGDARHIEPGFWRAYDFEGRRLGPRFHVGWDPDDLALTEDGRFALVLLSGRAEGETNRPAPSLLVVDLADPEHPRARGQAAFDRPGDDPERVAFFPARGRSPFAHLPLGDAERPRDEVRSQPCPSPSDRAAVSLRGSNAIAWIDLEEPDHPLVAARTTLPGGGVPGPLAVDFDGTLMATEAEGGTVWRLGFRGADHPRRLGFREKAGEIQAVLEPTSRNCGSRAVTFATNPDDSALEILDPSGRSLGRLPLRGALGFGGVIPTGLAVSGSLLAVADRSGGVHLVRFGNTDLTLPR